MPYIASWRTCHAQLHNLTRLRAAFAEAMLGFDETHNKLQRVGASEHALHVSTRELTAAPAIVCRQA